MRSVFLASLVVSAVLLASCGSDDPKQAAARGEAPKDLPTPKGTKGGVTGMPDRPGPGPIGAHVPSPEDVPLDENGNPILPDGVPEAVRGDTTQSIADVPGEPTPDDAVAVVRDYYAAINHGEFARAQGLWADGGRASGQSPQQFAAGFAETTGVSVEVMPPGSVDPAAGSRFVEVPVAITATQRDGSQLKYVGAYVLRRAVADGATPEQRAWRIASADIRQVQP